MPKNKEVYTIKVFVASSAELKKERINCILFLNQINKSYQQLRLESIEWEYDIPHGSFPDFSVIQDAINPLLKSCNFCIFLFYSKIGKFTREEFELANKLKKKIFPFFKKGFSPESDSELMNWKNLLDFKKGMNEKILYEEYNSDQEFEIKLKDNLNVYLSRTLQNLEAANKRRGTARGEADKNTKEIILSSQQLYSLFLELTITSPDPELKAKIEQGDEDELENAMDTQGGIPPVPLELQNFISKVVPIAEFLGNLDSKVPGMNLQWRSGDKEDSIYGFLILLALDNAYNCILSFGDLPGDKVWRDDSSKEDISSGFINEHYFQTGGVSYPRGSSVLSKKNESTFSYSISWHLDPDTFNHAIDKKINSITPIARLPKTLELIVLSDIHELPFEKNNFSRTAAINLWKTTMSNTHKIDKNSKFDASLKMIVNGIDDMAYQYKLKNTISETLYDEFEDPFELKCIKLIFDRN